MAQRIIIVHDNEQVKRRIELLLDNFLYFLQCANTHIARQRSKFKQPFSRLFCFVYGLSQNLRTA